MKRKEKQEIKITYFALGVALTVAGFVLIPPLLNKCSNMLYKAMTIHDEPDIDSLQPEIIRKEDLEVLE